MWRPSSQCSETRRRAEREWEKRREAWAAKADGGERGPEPTLAECAADLERDRLFAIIKDLVQWESTTNEAVLQRARDEIWQSWRRACADNADHPRAQELFDRHKLPAFHDPFAGGGALPLEAQRLGLEAYASDLNPVAVLIKFRAGKGRDEPGNSLTRKPLAKRSYVPPTASDDEVRALLARYECPLPFHEVRTLFLGNIASPSVGLSPIRVIERLWGGELPEFEFD